MSELKFGDRGPEVLQLQRDLNAMGFPIKEDGVFGNTRTGEDETGDALEMWQRENRLNPDRIYGTISQGVMQRELRRMQGKPTTPDISVKAFQLLLDYEVGGGEAWYNKKAKNPIWPGGASGITIGIGFDLGYEPSLEPWRGLINTRDFERLHGVMGLKSSRAKAALPKVKDIVIPWKTALRVFDDYTLPVEIAKTHQAFPGLWRLPLDVQGALVSLVYNRGAGMEGDSRREMREIRDAVWVGDVPKIAASLRSMKRLWPNVKGLQRRRDAEADLCLEAIA